MFSSSEATPKAEGGRNLAETGEDAIGIALGSSQGEKVKHGYFNSFWNLKLRFF